MPGAERHGRGANGRGLHFEFAYTYAHRGEGYAFEQACAANIRRLRKQRAGVQGARGPIPLVAADQHVKTQLEQARQRLVDRFRTDIERHRNNQELRALTPDEEAEMYWDVLRMDAAELTDILGPEALRDIPDPENTKIYVSHHGTWRGNLSTDPTDSAISFPVEDIPTYWKALGMPRNIGSVRLSSCESGDATPRRRFISYPPGYNGFFSADDFAPAQRFANKMKAVGFSRPRVTGYQGKGADQPEAMHHHMATEGFALGQGVDLPDTRHAAQMCYTEKVYTDFQRRSDVAMVFEPIDRDHRPKKLRYSHAYFYALCEPKGEDDQFAVALDENLRRLAKWIDAPASRKPRGPIKIIASSDEIKAALDAVRTNLIDVLADAVKKAQADRDLDKAALTEQSLGDDERELRHEAIESKDQVIKILSLELAAAEATRITGLEALATIPNEKQWDPRQRQAIRTAQLDGTKLYIGLHGGAGSNVLSTNGSANAVEVCIAQVAHSLAEHFESCRVTPRIGSIRLLSCESADTVRRKKFTSSAPGYSGRPFRRRIAPAQYLANKLQEDGFVRPRVTGYQGMGILWRGARQCVLEQGPEFVRHRGNATGLSGWGPESCAPLYGLRVIPAEEDTADYKTARRRSEVATVFKPKSRLPLCW
jgi:hypothetical protein